MSEYTKGELEQFRHGISLALLSKESAQHWGYSESTAKTIAWLKELEKKIIADRDNNMTKSHSEAEIYKGCISLMWELVGSFYEWLDFIGVDITKLDEEEQFSRSFYPTHIVERLFLWHTKHSGGTSQRMKCDELGIDTDDEVVFDFSEELENAE